MTLKVETKTACLALHKNNDVYSDNTESLFVILQFGIGGMKYWIFLKHVLTVGPAHAIGQTRPIVIFEWE